MSTAKNHQLIGQNMATHEWFQQVVKTNKPYVTDLYYSDTIHAYTMNYSSPIYDDHGKMVGVMSTRFNWQYVMEIVARANLGEESSLFIVNQASTVIASKDANDILTKSLSNYRTVQISMTGTRTSGYEIEHHELIAFSKSQGYNSYSGKGWMAVVIEKIRQQ